MNLPFLHDKPNAALLLENGATISHAELAQRAGATLHEWQWGGPNDAKRVVFCLCRNDLPSVVCYLAALASGRVPLLLPADVKPAQLASLLQAYQPHAVFGNSALLNLDGFGLQWQAEDYRLWVRTQGSSYPVHENLGLLLATSGSTGSPKLVRLSLNNLVSNASAIASYLGIGAQERAITSLPIHYSYGLSVLNSHLFSTASLVLTDRSLMDAGFWQAIKTRGVTSLAGVPYTYEMLLRLGIGKMELGTLRTLTQAGGRLPADKVRQVAQACQTRNIRFFPMYGQTEATARIAYVPCEQALERAGSIGRAIPGGSLWLEDDAGQRIDGAGVPGQLVYAGPNVSMGYALDWQDLAKGDENRGVLHTGDLALRDAEGTYTITGRLSRFVKLFGVRVSLDAVEAMLEQQGLRAAAFGDDDLLQVRMLEDTNHAPKQVLHDLAATLGVNPRAICVAGIEHLPRLENGKVDYQALKASA